MASWMNVTVIRGQGRLTEEQVISQTEDYSHFTSTTSVYVTARAPSAVQLKPKYRVSTDIYAKFHHINVIINSL